MSSIRVPRRTRRRTADTHHSPPRGPTLTIAAAAAATAGVIAGVGTGSPVIAAITAFLVLTSVAAAAVMI
ncbi:hypothetical protein ACFTWF_17015 [Rhodococcus sp. NPDC056960]|uniref:hypothetical protein n=1 Tax=Rhodococcus sp. NPDC056960 TaxID=3345982 RepID=UPI003640DC81